MSSSIVAEGFTAISALTVSRSRGVAVLAEGSGRLTLLDLLRQTDGRYESRTIGSGYDRPTHLAILESPARVVVADASGLWLAPLNSADRATATSFATTPGEVRALGVIAKPAQPPALLVLDALPIPRLVEYSLRPGEAPGATVATLVPGLSGAMDAVVTASGDVFVLANTPTGIRVHVADLGGGGVQQLPEELPVGGRLAMLDANWAVVASGDGWLQAANRVGVLRSVQVPGPGPVVAAATIDGARVLQATADTVVETALRTGFTDPVLISVPDRPLFIGGYAPVTVDTRGTEWGFEEIALSVDDSDRGAVSPSRDDAFDPQRPPSLLAAGWRTGEAQVVATRISTGEVVGRTPFTVTDSWPDADAGPSLTVTGVCNAPVVRPAWGGGGAGPQNVDMYRAPAAWRVAVVLLDTTSNPYPSDAAGLAPTQSDWTAAMTTGVTTGGVTRSVAGYFSEVSYNKLTVSLVGNAVAGPVHLGGDWDTYFEVENEPDPANPGMTRPRRWNPKPDAWKAFVSALEQANAAAAAATPPRPPLVDLGQTDAVAFVVRTVNVPDASVVPATATSIGRYVWPQQTTQTVKLNGRDANLPMLVMPQDWTAIDGRQLYETLTHEIGHSLQLPDLYLYDWMNQGLAPRLLRDWDLMHRDRGMPQLSLPTRMALGWVPPGEVRCYNFAANGAAAVLDNVTLQALGRFPIPAGSVRGVEVRIAQGRNYYFEYRSRQGAALGDANLPLGQVVMGVDVASPKGGQNYDSRPMTLRLFDDPDGRDDSDGILTEGAFLAAGDDYREKDFTEGAPKDFVATVTAVRPDSADLQIRYNSEAKPELSIRTWPNGDKQWQSPDIQVRNAKSDADSKWLNVPWGGNPNRVVATVRNHGGLEARDVRAFFSIKNLTTNADDAPPATTEPLGQSAPVTIPANATRELEVPWVAPEGGHFCITVDLPLYEAPGDPAVHESSDRDNYAQSNYDQFWSESASPSARKRFTVSLENPTDRVAIVFPRVRQTTAFYRTYLEHSWLRLGPLETREVGVMTESLDGDPAWQGLVDDHRETLWEVPNTLEISGWVHGVCAPQCTGGVTVEVRSGRASTIEDVGFNPEPGATGTVLRADGTPANHGLVLLTAGQEGDEPLRRLAASSEVNANGHFFVFLPGLEEGMVAQLSYLGGFGIAPCESDTLRVDF